MINLYSILKENLLTEDRASKIQSKIKKIIKDSKPNYDWNRIVTNANQNQIPYIQLVLNTFVSKFFGYDFSRNNIELAPHIAYIAFNQLDFIENNASSNDLSTLKTIVDIMSDKLNTYSQEKKEIFFENFNEFDFDDLVSIYSKEIQQQNQKSREESKAVKKIDGYNNYNIVQIDYFNESEKYYQYTQNLRTPWCLTHMKDMFLNYGDNGRNKIYFMLHEGFEDVQPNPNTNPNWNVPKSGKAPYDEWGYSMISVIVSPDGSLNNCCSRWNHQYGFADDFLNETELSELIGQDFYEVFIPYTEDEIEEREESGEFSEEDWTEGLITTNDGYEIGYLHEGTLYDMDRDQISDEGIYDSLDEVGSYGLSIQRIDGSYDLYTMSKSYSLTLKHKGVEDLAKVLELEDDWVWVGMEGEYIVTLSTYNGYDDYAKGYKSFEIIDSAYGIIIGVDYSNYIDLLCCNCEDMLVDTDIFYDNEHQIHMGDEDDDEEYDYVYYYKMESGNITKLRVHAYEGGEPEVVDYGDWTKIDVSELENIVPNYIDENTKLIQLQFNNLTRKLNEIHKRNKNDIIN